MASYITGLVDYVPQIQPFRPDFNFYSNILQVKQSQYDQAHRAISKQYGALVNGPMLRDTNIQRRDQFFKTIQTDIKKISGMDLSQEQNVNAAMQIFRPIYEDKYILKDMTYTRQFQNQMQRADAFRNCTDPDKCGGSYWDEGVRAMNYQADEFRNASDDESLNHSAPVFTPFVNLTQKAFKAAKDAGFNISVDSQKGGYIVTDTNGDLLLNGADGKAGILPNYLYGLFAGDQKIMDVFKTQAYVARKDWVKENAFNYGDENAAEAAYINNIISRSVPKLQKQAAVAKEAFDEIEATKTILENKIQQDGGVIPGSTEENSYNLLTQLLSSKPTSDKYHEEVLNTVETAKSLNDINHMRSRADAIIANGLFQDTIWNAAKEYAMGTKKTEAKADPYSLAKFNHQLELSNALTLRNHDFDIWKKKQEYENAAALQNLALLGVKPEDLGNIGLSPMQLAHLSPTQLRDLQKKGAFESGAGKKATLIGPAGGVNIETGYDKNRTVYDDQAKQVVGSSVGYLKDVANTMKMAYDQRRFDNSDKGKKEKLLLENKMKEVFKDTNFSVDDFLNGNISAEEINNLSQDGIVKSFDKISNMSADPTTYYWSGNLNQFKSERLKAIQDRQVFAKMSQIRIQQAQEVMKEKFADLKSKYANNDISTQEYGIAVAELASVLDANTVLRDPKTAAKFYAEKAHQYYQADSPYIFVEKGERIPNPNYKSAYQKAEEDFIKRGYSNVVQDFKEAHNNKKVLGEFAGSGGGSYGVPSAISWQIDPSKPYDPKVKRGNAVVESILNNIDSPDVVVFSPGVKLAGDIIDNPAKKAFAVNYLTQFKNQLGEHKTTTSPSFELTAQRMPDVRYQGSIAVPGLINIENTSEFQGGMLYKFTPNPATVKSMIGTKNYDPGADYSFMVKIPEELDVTGFVEQTKVSGVQALLNMPGQGLTLSDKDKGNLTVSKTDKGYVITGTGKSFDINTGRFVDVPVDPAPVPINISADNVFDYMQSYLDENYNMIKPYVDAYRKGLK